MLIYSYSELKFTAWGKWSVVGILCLLLMRKTKGMILPSALFLLYSWLEGKSLEFYAFAISALFYVFFDKLDPRNRDEDTVEFDHWEQKIRAFYFQHNPSKLGEVSKILARNKGKESELWEKLQKQYCPAPRTVTPRAPLLSEPPFSGNIPKTANSEIAEPVIPTPTCTAASNISTSPAVPRNPSAFVPRSTESIASRQTLGMSSHANPSLPKNDSRTVYRLESPSPLHTEEEPQASQDARIQIQRNIDARIAELKNKQTAARSIKL